MDQHQQRINSVLSSVQAQESQENAIGNYHMILDKWLATMAGVWSMGGNPWMVPLPWGPMPPIPGVNVVQNTPPSSPPESSRSDLGGVARGLLLGTALLGTGGLGAGITALLMRPSAIVKPVPTPDDTEWGVQIKVGDGAWGPWRPLPKEKQ